MRDLQGKKVALVATNGFEQAELEVPRDKLRAAGAVVDVISLKPGEIRGWDKTDWGRPVPVDKTIDAVSADQYDAIVLPGGVMNPDKLRVEPKVLDFIKAFWNQKKIVAAFAASGSGFPRHGSSIGGRHAACRNDRARRGAYIRAFLQGQIVKSRCPSPCRSRKDPG